MTGTRGTIIALVIITILVIVVTSQPLTTLARFQ
jgi:hypothetical protein